MEDRDEPQSRVLIVEGVDDLHVMLHLKRCCAPGLAFDILEKGSVDALIKSIDVEVTQPGRHAVGFVLDADDRLTKRWQAVAARLRIREIEAPTSPEPMGTFMEGGDGRPRVGVWLMPDNTGAGELEDFVAAMVPDGDPVWPLAKDYIEAVPKSYLRTKPSKAEIHAWLATRERPFPMGAAIGAGALNTDGPLCRSFADWLTRLFG